MSLHSSLPRVLILAGREPIVPGATLPGKTSRLIDHARRVVQRSGAVADVLDLGWLDHAADEASAWTKSVRERWNAAHGVMVLVPERWNTADSSLRSLVEELARDPTRVRETAYGVILQGEDPAAPFGDEKLAAHLEEMGLVPALDAADPLRSTQGSPGYHCRLRLTGWVGLGADISGLILPGFIPGLRPSRLP